MKIALDFDGTYTEDTTLWDVFISRAQERGHVVYIVTFRSPDMRNPLMDRLYNSLGVPILFTSRTAKRDYALKYGIDFDVWIDDQPELIVNGSDWSDEEVEEWRKQTNNGMLGGQSG